MKDIIEEYGTGILSLIVGVLMMGVVFSCFRPGGILSMAVVNYMNGICG